MDGRRLRDQYEPSGFELSVGKSRQIRVGEFPTAPLDDSVVRLIDMAPLDDAVTVRMCDEAPHDLLLGGEVDPPGKAAMAAAAAAAMVLVRVISHPPFASRRRAGDERCGL